MESEISSSSFYAPQQASNYDELFMQHSLLFADSLKDLKNLRKQLYSAAEYFELSYDRDDKKQLVVETLKDYVTNALISTVDHLGSVAFKVNNFMDEKVNEVSGTKLRLSCIEQRLWTYQEFIDRQGFSQQSLVIKTPKYHKQYIIPVGGTMLTIGKTKLIYNGRNLCPEDYSHQCKYAVQATEVKPHSSFLRKGHHRLPSTESSSLPGTFSFSRVASNKGLEKRSVSPLFFPLKRAGSLVNRSISPSPSNSIPRYPSEPWRSASLGIHPERDITKENEQYSKKSKNLLKALLSRHKTKKEGRLYR